MSNINVIRPLSTNIIHIRSKDGFQFDDGFNTHFKIDLISAINILPENEAQITITSAEIPYSFYNISDEVKNNKIYYSDGGVNKTFTFASLNYDIDKVIKTITDDSVFPFTATFDKYSFKITLTNTSSNTVVIDWINSTSDKLLGFTDNENDTVLSGGSVSSPFVINLCTVHSIFIKSNLSVGNVQSSRVGNSTTLQKISIDNNGFDMIYLNQSDFRTTVVSQANVIDFISFRITDQNDNLIQLNNVNFEFSILVQIFPNSSGKKRRGLPDIIETINPESSPVPTNVNSIITNKTKPVLTTIEPEDTVTPTVFQTLLEKMKKKL